MYAYAKREYEMVSKVLRETRQLFSGGEASPAAKAASLTALSVVVAKFTDAFRNDNPRFEIDRFIKACAFDPEELQPSSTHRKDT